jgi:hypothetical protein
MTMGHTIALEVPENLYEAIRSQAAKRGQTPDSLAAAWLAEAVQSAEQDALVKLFGTIQSDVTDVAERHDFYIGQSLFRTLHNGE